MNIEALLIRRSDELALRGEGRTGINPMVGAVVYRDKQILGEGWHRFFGGPHAEINAIADTGKENSPGASICVSLEPCNHQGKTPACTKAILSEGLRRVSVDQIDPNERMQGESLYMLRSRGLEVNGPADSPLGRFVLEPFRINVTQKRPFITIKMAVSADGFIGQTGRQCKISNAISNRWVHKIRSRHQAIMAGTNTILNDNPSLTARYHHSRQPVRVLIDREGRLPSGLNVFRSEGKNLVFTSSDRPYPNAEIVSLPDIRLKEVMHQLYQREIGSILVEGGARLARSFFDENLWDRLIVIRSTKVKLGTGISAPDFPVLPVCHREKLGSDIWEFVKREDLR